MRAIAITTLAALCLAAAPATAKTDNQEPAAVAGSESKQATADPAEKKVCKRLKMSGTRMADRVCLTADDWKKVEEQN